MPAPSKIDVEEVAALRRRGVPITELARRFKCSEGAIHRRLRKAGLMQPKRPPVIHYRHPDSRGENCDRISEAQHMALVDFGHETVQKAETMLNRIGPVHTKRRDQAATLLVAILHQTARNLQVDERDLKNPGSK